MPSKSKAQQRFMGMVHAVKKGELSPSKVSDKVKKAASSMSKKDAKDFASTKHKGKPEKVKQETRVRSLIKKMVREVLDEIELEEGFLTGKKGEKQSTKNRSEVFDYKMVGDNDNPTFDLSTDTGRGDGNFPSGNLSSLKEGKRRQLKIPVMDKLKTNKILKKLKMKIGKDYDIGVGKGSTFVLDVDQKVLNKILDPLISNRIRVKEGKLKEDYKNSKWEVYVGDDAYGKNRKVVKVAKSKRAATILYNKLIKTDKYFEVGMRAVKEGTLSADVSYSEGRVKVSSDIDADFRGNMVQIISSGGSIGLSKKSFRSLLNLIRTTMGRTYESIVKITEGKRFKLPDGIVVELDKFKGVTIYGYKNSKVVLDRKDLAQFLRAAKKNFRIV